MPTDDDRADLDHENDTETNDSDAASLPIARPKRATPEAIETAFGIVSPEVRTWTAARLTVSGGSEPLMSPNSRGTEVGEWPIHELSEEEVARRWGAGTYLIRWFGVNESGARHPRGKAKPFRITQELVDRVKPPPPPAPVAPAPSMGSPSFLPPEMQQTIALMGFFNQQTSSQLGAILGAARDLGGGARGPDQTVEIVRLMFEQQMRAQADQTRLLVEAIQAGNAATVAAIGRAMGEDGEGDEGGDANGVASGVARVAATAVRKKSGTLGQILDIASDHPQLVPVALQAGTAALQAIASVLKPPPPPVAPPPQAQAPAPALRPRAMPKPPAAPVAEEPGLNAFASAQKPSAPPPVIVAPEAVAS